ncbi:MAG: Transport-associated protein [Gemmatimonadetes bacterium]|nr:Transport-associated protein [Gemmatimonadota bacterium]
MFRSDTDIQKDIVEELKWDPSIGKQDIAVAVRDGVVTLSGFADSYAAKWRAEQDASRVKGVKAVANDVEVKLPSSSTRPDPDIAHAAVDALRWNIFVPHDRIKVKVEKGWVTLEGEVEWNYQKEEAERAIRNLTGVRGVSNLITVRSHVTASDVKKKIQEALERGAEFDADRITVELDGNKVILRGIVRSYAESKDAERAARKAPGVSEVENKLVVDPTVVAPV